MREVFRTYLDYQYHTNRCVTLGQKLALVESLLQEARQGVVPISREQVARLSLDDPRVRAVIQGERIALETGSVDVRSGIQLSNLAKIGILVGIFLIPIIVAFIFLNRRSGSPMPIYGEMFTPTFSFSSPGTTSLVGDTGYPEIETPTPVLLPTPTPTEISLGTATPGSSIIFRGDFGGDAPDDLLAPVSIEMNNIAYVVGAGKIGRNGIWQPTGVEWLEGTLVRRVIALPRTSLEEMSPKVGDRVYVRLRNGTLIFYVVSQILESVPPNRTELLSATKPSLLLLGYGQDTLLVVIGELLYLEVLPNP